LYQLGFKRILVVRDPREKGKELLLAPLKDSDEKYDIVLSPTFQFI